MSEYLCYWTPHSVAEERGTRLDHSAGNQLKKVERGDHLWIVTYDQGSLFLCGHLEVHTKARQRQAERGLGQRLRNAGYHAIAARGKAEPMRLVDITAARHDLRFLGGKKDRLPSTFSALNLQSMRRLSPESAAILKKEWRNESQNSLGMLREETFKASHDEPFDPHDLVDARRRVMRDIVSRQGQPQFRRALLDAYNGRCAISDCDVEFALEAAHIRPYFGPLTHAVSNGLLLGADLHTLFDLGRISVGANDHRVLLAPELQN